MGGFIAETTHVSFQFQMLHIALEKLISEKLKKSEQKGLQRQG